MTHEVMAFGRRAKAELVQLSRERTSWQSGPGCSSKGSPGRASVRSARWPPSGCALGGNDGRVLWLEGLRELCGVWRVADLLETLQVVAVETASGQAAGGEDRLALGGWVRPILREGRMVLLVERPDVGQAAVGVADHGAPSAGGAAGDEGRGKGRSGRNRDEHIEWVLADRARIKQLSQ